MATNRPTALSGRTRTRFDGELTQPANSGYTILLDTTRGTPDNTRAAPGISATLPTVGSMREQALGRIYGILASVTAQNATLVQYGLHADGAWKLFASTTLTADADPQSIAWDPSAYGYSDVLVAVLAGATKPTKTYARLTERTIP